MSGSADAADGESRPFRAFDVCVVVAAFVALSFGVGALWSTLRIGTVLPLFVREAQFLLAVVLFGLWVVRNRSGGRIEEVDDSGTISFPPLRTRVGLYRRLTGDPTVTGESALDADVYVFAIATAFAVLSLGVEAALLGLGS